MIELECSRTLFKELLDNVDIKDNYKDILKDKYINELTIDEMRKKYYLSRSSIYHRLSKARKVFNKSLCTEQNRLPQNIRQSLENYRKFL